MQGARGGYALLAARSCRLLAACSQLYLGSSCRSLAACSWLGLGGGHCSDPGHLPRGMRLRHARA
jgi:hypothetical protein